MIRRRIKNIRKRYYLSYDYAGLDKLETSPRKMSFKHINNTIFNNKDIEILSIHKNYIRLKHIKDPLLNIIIDKKLLIIETQLYAERIKPIIEKRETITSYICKKLSLGLDCLLVNKLSMKLNKFIINKILNELVIKLEVQFKSKNNEKIDVFSSMEVYPLSDKGTRSSLFLSTPYEISSEFYEKINFEYTKKLLLINFEKNFGIILKESDVDMLLKKYKSILLIDTETVFLNNFDQDQLNQEILFIFGNLIELDNTGFIKQETFDLIDIMYIT